MGQSALHGFIKVLQHLGGSLSPCYRLAAASSWKRPIFLLIVSIILSLWLAAGNVDANVLFQSPQSPPVEPAAVEPPPVQQAPVEQPPIEQPVEPAPVEPAPVEQAPVEQAPVEQQPVEPAPVEQAPVEQQPTPEAVPATDQPNALAAPEPDIPRSKEASVETETNASSNFILDQAEFIDTVVVSGAYIWLCCGVSLFLLVPLFLLFVYIRGRSKILQEENF